MEEIWHSAKMNREKGHNSKKQIFVFPLKDSQIQMKARYLMLPGCTARWWMLPLLHKKSKLVLFTPSLCIYRNIFYFTIKMKHLPNIASLSEQQTATKSLYNVNMFRNKGSASRCHCKAILLCTDNQKTLREVSSSGCNIIREEVM